MKSNLILMLFMVIISQRVSAQTKTSGYEKSIEFGYQMELRQPSTGILRFNNDIDAFSAIFVNGHRFNDYVFLGGGLGFEYSTWEELDLGYSGSRILNCETYSIPILIRGKFNFTKGKVSPYALIDAGYNLFLIGSPYRFEYNSRSYKRSGVFINPALGVDFKLTSKQTLFFNVGCDLLRPNTSDYYESYLITSLSFKLGLKF